MKKLFAIVMVLVLVLSMAACGAKEEAAEAPAEDQKTVGILMPTKEQTIWSIQGDRLVEGFEEAGGVGLVFLFFLVVEKYF